MDYKKSILIKEEEPNEICGDPGSIVQVYPSNVNVKEEQADGANQEFLEDLLKSEELSFHIKQDRELKRHVDGSEHNCLEDKLGISWSIGFIKEDPELILEGNEAENIVIASPRYASDGIKLVQNSGERHDISFEENVTQRVVHDELEKNTEESTYFTTFRPHTHRLASEEDILFNTSLKCSLRENEFHKFKCSFCLQSFPSKYRLIIHVFIHIDGVQPPTYVCKYCGEVFPNNVSLDRHLKTGEGDAALSAGNNKKFDCRDDHKNIFMEGDREVSATEQNKKQLLSMETWKSSKKSFTVTRNNHTEVHDAEEPNRSDNSGTLSTASNVNANAVLLTIKRPHKCKVCSKSFALLGILKKHALIHTGKKPHKCDICTKSFTYLGDLKKHALIHTGRRPHKCNICDKSFTQLAHLKSHSFVHTGKKPHSCDVCGKSVAWSGNLKVHTLVHTGKRPHKCDICKKSFALLCNLKTHMLTHSGRKPHKCDSCGKSFTQLYHLKRHTLIHTGMRPHKCHTCGKSFARMYTLKTHAVIHTGKRPHKCGICGSSFTQLGNLNNHALTHSGKRPHKCDICGKSFALLSSLKRHCVIHTRKISHK